MEDLIVKLLKENGRVILPDFGAFIVKTKTPFTVIFNEFLQYNDGALISAAEAKLKISRDDAAEKVKEYTAEINEKLDNGESISLTEIGLLSKSATGKIALSKGEAEAAKEDVKAEEKPSSTVEFDIAETKNEPVKQKAEPETVKKVEPEKKEIKIPAPGKTPEKKVAEVKTTPPVEKKVEKPIEVKKEEPVKEPMPISEYYEENSSRNKLSIILWALAILLVNGTIFYIFDDELKAFFGKKKAPQVELQIDTPEIVDEVIPITEESTTPVEELVIEDTPEEVFESDHSGEMITGKKYYVVAGVFKEESNADNLVKALREKGYNAEKFGKIGTLHAVSYEVFPTKPEADKFMMKIKREIDSEAWIRIVN